MRRRTWAIVVGVVAAVVLAVAVAVVLVGRDQPPLPTVEARALASALADGRGPTPAATRLLRTFREGAAIASTDVRVTGVRRRGGDAEATFAVEHVLRGLGPWRYTTTVRFDREDDEWLPVWAPAVVHPRLVRGDTVVRTRTRPTRGAILAADGSPLTSQREVVTVGVEPRRITDRAALHAAFGLVDVSAARVERALTAPGVQPHHFVAVVDLPPERFDTLRTRLAPVPGIVFRRQSGRVAAEGADGLAATTLGRVGEATAEELTELGARYEPGDVVGRSGLERTFETRLAGTPSGTVAFDGPEGSGRHVVVHEVAGRPPEDVATTLRPDLQRAAEAALARVGPPSALVALDAATGGILAVANGPVGSTFNRALAGRYPPGSTFKVVTSEALLADGRTPATPVTCPPTATVGGRRFRNFEGEAFGDQSLLDAFAHSCNTAFVTEAEALANEELVAAARRFGFDTPYRTGAAASHASFPLPRDTTERAAAAIGQARVLTTPVHMASVAAAVADGTWRAPHLGARVPASAVARASLTPGALDPLRTMMRAVVTSGTGTAAAGVAGLAGKTGTAEFGTGDPLPTHAWFIGFRNGVGFAVVVEGGGVGGRVAAPIAARFASAL